MTNQELIAQAGQALGRMGVQAQKSATAMTTASMAAGDYMNRKQVERLVDLTVSQSAWLSAVSLKLRKQRAGEIPRMNLNDVVTEGVEENGGSTVASHPTTDYINYNCGKFQATWYYTLEDIRESKASGEPDFEGKIRRAFAKAMSNDLARWTMKGDTTLGNSTRLNRLLRKRDGWLKKLRANATRYTTGRGAPFARAMFEQMMGGMPEEYRDDSALRWLLPNQLDLAWTTTLADPTNAQGGALGDKAVSERNRFKPYGISQLIVPQIPTDQGFSVVSASTAAADAVVDNTTYLTAQVDTLFGGYDSKWAGRRVKITLNSTGASEIGTVVDTGSQLDVSTTGTLGQTTISTTAGDYTLDLADITSSILINPKNLLLVMCDKMRAYRKFEQEAERWRIDVYYEADVEVFNENAAVLQDGVALPQFEYGSGW